MKVNQTLEECKKLAESGKYGVIPLATEIFGDAKTPIEILRILKRVSRHVYLLESADSQKRWSRYSFLGYDPVLEISCRNGETKIKTALTTQIETKDVKTCIREVLKENQSPVLPELPAFTGGLVGYFSYDYIKYAEPTLKLDAKDEEGFSDWLNRLENLGWTRERVLNGFTGSQEFLDQCLRTGIEVGPEV